VRKKKINSDVIPTYSVDFSKHNRVTLSEVFGYNAKMSNKDAQQRLWQFLISEKILKEDKPARRKNI
jgi:hypothetical protein